MESINISLKIDEVNVNRLAQIFYEASGIHLMSMTDKPLVIKGLEAVFTELGIEVDRS